MIFLLSEKIWNKSKKKLVEPKNYIIVDATDSDGSRLDKFTNLVTIDNLALPPKLIHVFDDESFEEIMDMDALKEMEDKFFHGPKFEAAVMAVISAFVDEDINVFIIIRNKAYAAWRKKYKKAFIEVFPKASNFFVILSKKVSENEKDLYFNFSSPELEEIKRGIAKKEKEMEERTKKAKKKSKDKKKKKKWKTGLGFEDWD